MRTASKAVGMLPQLQTAGVFQPPPESVALTTPMAQVGHVDAG